MDHKTSVLIVDDRQVNLDLLEAMMQGLDVDVIRVESGMAAIDAVAQREPALVLLDVLMPGMNGFQTARAMHALANRAHMPIVFITAGGIDAQHAGYEAGAVDYITKPFDAQTLRSKIKVFLALYELRQQIARQAQQLEEQNAKLEVMTARLYEESMQDPLTGLHNRRFLAETIMADIAVAQRLSLKQQNNNPGNDRNYLGFLVLDIDHFKHINDEYGHGAGDQVLIAFASRILALLRDTDSFVRWGGEEFLILLRRYAPDTLTKIAERIRAAVDEADFCCSTASLRLTCSVGFSHYPVIDGHCYHWEDVVALADQALYLAKASGRNTWVGVDILTPATRSAEKDTLLMDLNEAERRGMVRLVLPESPESASGGETETAASERPLSGNECLLINRHAVNK